MYRPSPLIWTTPSRDPSGSMPLGNGDIGLNVWVEENGDLLFYLSKTDAWDENSGLLKLGRVRLAISPNPFRAGLPFSQELDLAAGAIRIHCAVDNRPMCILIWADANRPVVRFEITSERPVEVRAAVEIWRTSHRLREGAEGHCPVGLTSPGELEHVYPDTLIPAPADTLLWCHRNCASCWSATLKHQDLAEWIPQGKDPLIGRTFGVLLRGDGLQKTKEYTIATPRPITRIVLSAHVLTAQTQTLDQWADMLRKQAKLSDSVPLEKAYTEHSDWWGAFWQRSWIRVWGTPEAEIVTRGYELQRFINACGGRGAYPIKFNGSIFTADAREDDATFDADYRRWGGCYWFQNTRLIYWPMIMSGDFDLMEPWFKLYIDALPLAKMRAKKCFSLENAAMFPETITFWGTFQNRCYGYDRTDLQPGLCASTYIRLYWQGMLELLAVLLDAYAVSGDDRLLREKLLLLAPPFLNFYRGFYKQRDNDGKILLEPSQSLETWHQAVNPSPDIAGLQWVLDGLLALPETHLPQYFRAELREFRQLLPPLPMHRDEATGRKKVLPALTYDSYKNSENPELYVVFPYRLFGVGKADLDVGLATWDARLKKASKGWRQDAIQAALLGLTDEAKSAVVHNFSTPHPASRFPAFWGPNFDWIPDQDHGNVACIALQRMCLQFDAGKLRLLPAWPADWDVDFKLHAPGQTVVAARCRGGRIEALSVSPQSRRKDLEVSQPVR